MKRRMINHDYTKGYYMVTLSLSEYMPRLSRICGSPFKSRTADDAGNNTQALEPETDLQLMPRAILYPMGEIVSREVYALPSRFPVEVKHLVIMPDHIHLLVNLHGEETGTGLGAVISSLKGKCSSYYWSHFPNERASQTRLPFWEPGYNDRPLYSKGQLPNFFNYIQENPRRYLIRKSFPDFFYRRWTFSFNGRRYHAIGNLFLLQYHTRVQIRFSRKYSEERLNSLAGYWRAAAQKGDVVISTFIHPVEKETTKNCLDLGAKLIWIKTEPFPEKSILKGDRAYRLCAQGKLLMIAPEEGPEDKKLSYSFCMRLNELGAHISQTDISSTLTALK